MKRNGAGGAIAENDALLSPDWHKALSEKQLMAYVRHSYIWRQSGSTDLAGREQTKQIPKWDGGQDAYGVKFTPVWPKIVRMIRAVDADPGIWIAAHFSPIATRKYVTNIGSFEIPDVTPTNLCGKLSETIYHEYCSDFPKITIDGYNAAGRSIALRLRSLKKLNISDDDRHFCVICDEGYVAATPIVRQGFANAFNLPQGIERYLWPAALEYESKQALYDRIIPAFIPGWLLSAQLLETVKTIRAHWRRYEQLAGKK